MTGLLALNWSPENPHRRRLRWLLDHFVYKDLRALKFKASLSTSAQTFLRMRREKWKEKGKEREIKWTEVDEWGVSAHRFWRHPLWRQVRVFISKETGGHWRAEDWRPRSGKEFLGSHPQYGKRERARMARVTWGRLMVKHLWESQKVVREFMEGFVAVDEQGRKRLAAQEVERLVARFRPRGRCQVAQLPDAVLLATLRAMEHVPPSLMRRCPHGLNSGVHGHVFIGKKSQRCCAKHQKEERKRQWREAQARQRKRKEIKRRSRRRRR